jgi:hypothetical protein
VKPARDHLSLLQFISGWMEKDELAFAIGSSGSTQ